jgi:hypothetical protein
VLHQPLGRILAIIGLSSVVIAEVLPSRPPQGFLAGFGFFALLASAVLAVVGSRRTTGPHAIEKTPGHPPSTWRWTLIGLGAVGGLVVQTWFRSGTLIAGGDVAPPIGTAWIGRIFASYGWSGNNLGGPQANQGQLPFAALDALVHAVGGSGALTQRIWYSLLVAGIMVAAGALARSLGLTPVAGITVAVLFFFNPMTMSQVGINDVFLVAMLLLAALPAAVISHGRGNLRTWQLSVVFVASAPLLGFAYANPPLVAMVVITAAASPLLVLLRFGRNAAGQSVRGLLIGGAFAAAASAYWLIPSQVAAANVATGTLLSLPGWAFTESRSTLANGLWLNTIWAWQFPQYFPYAREFEHLPLVLTRPLVPLVAFGALVLPDPTSDRARRLTRLAGALAIGVLGIVLLSNGTESPGKLVFDPLYRLPYGWLLREPGRFLMVAALGFALLAGVLIDRLRERVPTKEPRIGLFHSRTAAVLALPKSMGMACIAIVIALAAAFPLWTGAIVPGPYQSFPSVHVKVPTYWGTAASYLNSSHAPRGALLVLPPDDFYQMPYTWYYGNDSFIPNLLARNVLVPSAQGYESVSSEVLDAVSLEAEAIVDGRWDEASRLLSALGTPLVLVRGDIISNAPQRNIVSPVALAKALTIDPEMQLIHTDGPLSVYRLLPRYDLPPTEYATMVSDVPDLQALAVLPQRTALITSAPVVGHMLLVAPPPPSNWSLTSNTLTTQLQLPAGWTYSVQSIGIGSSSVSAGSLTTEFSHTGNGGTAVRLRAPLGGSLLANGDFRSGAWSPVGNCDKANPVSPSDTFGGVLLPHAAPGHQPALQLSASIDSACESTPLSWSGGRFILHLSARSLSGSAPHFCLWEEPIGRCATTPPLPSGRYWGTFSSIVTPDAGTQTITLFLYADAPTSGTVSIEQYGDVTVRSVVSVPNIVLLGTPTHTATFSHLVSTAQGYSPLWSRSGGAPHVIVDGMANGWITAAQSTEPSSIYYVPIQHEKRNMLLFAFLMIALASAIWLFASRSRRRLSNEPPAVSRGNGNSAGERL